MLRCLQGKGCLTVEEFRELLTTLKTSELNAHDAVPIAFKARWLRDHSPAAWVGVTPLRTYTVHRETVNFDMILQDYKVEETWSTVGFFERDGDLIVAVNDKSKWNDNLEKKSGPKPSRGKGLHHPNVKFYEHAPVLAPEFTILVRQGECDGIGTWQEMAKHPEAFSEGSITINLKELADAKDHTKLFTVEFPVGNTGRKNVATFKVRIHPPEIPELKVPRMKSATAGNTAVKN
jgi:hypothetical protein